MTSRPHARKLRVWVALAVIGSLLAVVQPVLAVPRSESIALVPSSGGQSNFGGFLPTTIAGPGVPIGYVPTFTNVLPATIADGTIANPITTFDTVVLVGICNIGTFLADVDFKTRIEAFVSAGGKLIIWDSECPSTDYSGFVYPFTTSNPGQLGANGVLTDVEENSLSSLVPADPEYVNVGAVATGTDAVGDANVFVSFNQNWCTDLRATNGTGANGPVQTYAHLGSGLIVYNGLDKDFMSSVGSFDPASGSGADHLDRIWLLQLLTPVNPDNLPCGVKVFGLSLSPQTATNPAGTSHTVTAHVTTNAAPTAGVLVTFTVTAGPNLGQTGTATTDVNGDATFTYTSNGTGGLDTIGAEATLTGTGGVQTTVSDEAEKTWTGGGDTLTGLSDAHLWLGLRNSDDQGTQFDVKVELFRGTETTPLASGLTRCVVSLTRNATFAKNVTVAWDPFIPVSLAAGDALYIKISTRIGTTPTGAKCPGPGGSHNNARALRFYYDAENRASNFDATIGGTNTVLYFHSDGGGCDKPSATRDSQGVNTRYLDAVAPTGTLVKCKDSGNLNFNGGNPYTEVGRWTLP